MQAAFEPFLHCVFALLLLMRFAGGVHFFNYFFLLLSRFKIQNVSKPQYMLFCTVSIAVYRNKNATFCVKKSP
ncbi:unnamed protein product [Staurois parvus]|uniref:Secreted protein n=1 Tax=Staurois parvus TaxID=386267 RepID=A0ABN9CAG2_9NEOB|nr:unnamed protein product [Staurois parvus]